MLTFLVTNGGYLMCCLAGATNPGIGIFFLITPLIQGLSLATYGEIELQLYGNTRTEIGFMIILSLLCYGIVAFFLLGFCKSRFEIVADRPRRDNPLRENIFEERESESGSRPEPDRRG